MEKLDLKKQYKNYYFAKKKPELQHIEAAHYLSITGKGDPDSEHYAKKVKALFAVAYGVKYEAKAAGQDFVVPKLEGLWWFDAEKYGKVTLGNAPTIIPRSEWFWRMMIRMPEFVAPEAVTPAIELAVEKKQLELAREVSWFTTDPEKVAQILHIGPFDREPETLRILQEFIEAHELQKAGVHHEIYLSDIRRTDPEKWRTILREPVS